ncbi:MAG: SDR family oxidoreductase [Streptomyces sp.]|nr:SDR family oxidoreductase [Streptomyces sp.]
MTTSALPLSGRVAVVTGASSGIGEASAEHLASLGARVAVLARRAERLDDLVARIEKNGGEALALTVDVDLNVNGLMHAISAFTPQLVASAAERGVADLINTSSIAAQNIFPTFAVYSATKAYVSHLSRHLRTELGPRNVRVSALEPGIVGTELQGHVTDEGARAWLDGARESMEWLIPQDIAETVGFIASLPPRVNVQQVTVMPTGQAS